MLLALSLVKRCLAPHAGHSDYYSYDCYYCYGYCCCNYYYDNYYYDDYYYHYRY